MKLLLIVSLFIFESIPTSFAYIVTPKAECSAIDFRNSFPLIMRNQHTISWCFSHAASDYLQYSFQIPEQISAADIAINYYNSKLPTIVNFFRGIANHEDAIEPPQTGFIAIAISRIRKEGYCPESVFPSETWTRVDTSTGTRSQVELLFAIEQLWDLQKQVQSGRFSNSSELPWFLGLKNLDQSRLYDLLKNTKKSKLLNEIRTTVCEGNRKPFPNIPIRSHFDLKGPRFFEKMNASFNQNMPVTIDFFSGVFDNYDHYRKSIGDLHTVLMYGRKFNESTGECTYLMKNSHGSDCSLYDPKIKCESGYLWFPESKVYEMMFSRLILERQ